MTPGTTTAKKDRKSMIFEDDDAWLEDEDTGNGLLQ